MIISNEKRAFTLIELSIVLIIIGLIIGGILSGQELIAQSRVRSLVKDITALQTSVNAFKLKYSFLPGDFPNASTIFGCTAGAAPTGCNGNGDWILTQSTPLASGSESFRFWQHLNLAGLLPYSYGGTNTSTDVFQSSYNKQTLIGVRNLPAVISPSKNYYEIGAWDSSYKLPDYGSITPIDAYGIDSKIDDGVWNKGNFFGPDGSGVSSGLCSSSNTYNMTGNQGLYCRGYLVIN